MTQNAWNTPYPDANGEILIGSTGARPVAATLTEGSNISITNGAGSITIASTAVSGDIVKISTSTASNSATISFTDLSSTYHAYIIEITGIQPATDSVTLYMRTSTNNGSSYDSAASDYAWNVYDLTGAAGTEQSDADTADSELVIAGDVTNSTEFGTASNELGDITVYLYDPSATSYTFFSATSSFVNQSTANSLQVSTGYRISAADVDAIQFLFDTGNISIGTFTLYGVTA